MFMRSSSIPLLASQSKIKIPIQLISKPVLLTSALSTAIDFLVVKLTACKVRPSLALSSNSVFGSNPLTQEAGRRTTVPVR